VRATGGETREASGSRPPEKAPAAPDLPRKMLNACYIDFENVFFSAHEQGFRPSVPRMVRQLNRLSRQRGGEGWASTGVYAHWDALAAQARHVQDDWAMLGWQTVAVPTREDYVSRRTVKNLVDFVMSLDMLEHARDRGYHHFCIVSGDSDFCEVVERLKRLGRRVTVVSLRPSLSLRLSEAADECIIWGVPDISGVDSLPEAAYRRFEEVVRGPGRAVGEDPFQVLMRAVRMAERDQGVAPVSWVIIRDEYFRKMASMSEDESDRFADMLSRAGFLTMVRKRGKDGKSHTYVSIPH
jgi:uncharacterized LabA/DUF88 family protein